VGHLLTLPNSVTALDALADRLDRFSFRVDEAPQWFGGGLEVGEDSQGGQLAKEDQFIVTTMTNKGISQEIVHYQEDLGAHTAEITPMPLRNSQN
jgi:hypothetical protein